MVVDDWSLILLLTVAVWFDCREDRIPNELIYIGITGWLLVVLNIGALQVILFVLMVAIVCEQDNSVRCI